MQDDIKHTVRRAENVFMRLRHDYLHSTLAHPVLLPSLMTIRSNHTQNLVRSGVLSEVSFCQPE
jgi:hypothetical protein